MQEQYHCLLKQADDVVYVSKEYNLKCMLERNRYLVDHASILVAVYDGSRRSGTGATVRYAQQLGREIYIINPTTRNIRYECKSDCSEQN